MDTWRTTVVEKSFSFLRPESFLACEIFSCQSPTNSIVVRKRDEFIMGKKQRDKIAPVQFVFPIRLEKGRPVYVEAHRI